MAAMTHDEHIWEGQSDRRKAARFALRGEARFECETANGQRLDGRGVSRNLSRNGVFVETETVLPVASAVTVEVTLASGVGKGLGLRLHGMGEVRHIEAECAGTKGFGALVGFRTNRTEHE